MTAQMTGLLFGGGAVAIIGGIAAYFIARHLRGSIKLVLPKDSHCAGEAITGEFEVLTRKEIQGNRLYAALIGREETEERDGAESRTHTREVHRYEQTLEQALTWPAGQTKRYAFRLPAPAKTLPPMLDSTVARAARIGLELLGASRRRVRWTVEIRLDAKGIDLATSRRVQIND